MRCALCAHSFRSRHRSPQVSAYTLSFTTGAHSLSRAQNKPNSGDLARIAKLESTISKATSELEKLQERAGAIKSEIAGYEQKILEIGGSKLLAQKSKVEGISLHISIANDEITKAEVAKSKAEKDVTKYTKSIETNQAALEETTAEVESLDEEIEETTGLLDQLRENVSQANDAVDQAKDEMDRLKSEVDAATEKIREFRQLEVSRAILTRASLDF